QRILDANPDSAQAARDLSVSQERLGSFHLQRGQAGDIETALDYFNKSLETDQRILDANPDSAQAARDLSVSQERLGSFHLQRGQAGDIETALDYFNKSLETLQRILDANPDSAQAARDLSVSQERLGSFHLQRGQPGDVDTALEYLTKATGHRDTIWAANPSSALLGQELARTLFQLGQALFSAGQETQAGETLERLLRHLDDMRTKGLDLGNLAPLHEQLSNLRNETNRE
ncbi:tetratricopeptide repeat protein, partial [Roseibium alexandrii]